MRLCSSAPSSAKGSRYTSNPPETGVMPPAQSSPGPPAGHEPRSSAGSTPGGASSLRRRRSTAIGSRDFKRPRPLAEVSDSGLSSVSSLSSLADAYDSNPSQASVQSALTGASGQTQATETSSSSRSTFRRLTNQVRSVFSRRASTPTVPPPAAPAAPAAAPAPAAVLTPSASAQATPPAAQPPAPANPAAPVASAVHHQSPPPDYVNTAIPGTPGMLEQIAPSRVATRLRPLAEHDGVVLPPIQPAAAGPNTNTSSTTNTLPASMQEPLEPAVVAPTVPLLTQPATQAEPAARDRHPPMSFLPPPPIPTQAPPPVPAPAYSDIFGDHERDLLSDITGGSNREDRADIRRRISPDETTQVEMISRVLLAAATLTAARLVGSHFGRGELYGGSNEAAAMRRRAQEEIENRRRERAREEGEPSRSDDGDREEEHSASDESRDSLDSVSDSPPQEYTFSTFLEQLRTGHHSTELSNAMFGNPDANFFRLFRFPEDHEGRIPILLLGIRAADRTAQSLADEDGSEVWEGNPDPASDHGVPVWENNPDPVTDPDAPVWARSHRGAGTNGGGPSLDYGFSDSDEGQGDSIDDLFHDDEDDRIRILENEYSRGLRSRRDEIDPLFDEEEEDDDDEDDDEDDDGDDDVNPFASTPHHHHQHGDGAMLLNSLISGLASVNSHTHSHAQDSDDWHLRQSRARRPSVSNDSSSETGAQTSPRNHQSWVIYVIGGAYARTHPIFFAPSLMTDNPTYEDLLIVEQLLGPVKPPTASRTDLDSAGGTFEILHDSKLLGDRCPVCLMDYQEQDMCRTLNCKHTFHQECVDSWLTRSHNTCPMCRTEGVPTSSHIPGRSGFAAA